MKVWNVTLFCGLVVCGSVAVAAQTVKPGSDAQFLASLTTRLTLSNSQQQEIADVMQREGQKRVGIEASQTQPASSLNEANERLLALQSNYVEETKAIEHVLNRVQRSAFRRYTTVELPVEHELRILGKEYQLTGSQHDALRPILTDVVKTSYSQSSCREVGDVQPISLRGMGAQLVLDSRAKPVFTEAQWKQFQQDHGKARPMSCSYLYDVPSSFPESNIKVNDITYGITH